MLQDSDNLSLPSSESAEPPPIGRTKRKAEPPPPPEDADGSVGRPQPPFPPGEAAESKAKPKPPPPSPPKEADATQVQVEDQPGERSFRDWLLLPRVLHGMSGFSISAVLHAILMLVLAMVFAVVQSRSTPTTLTVNFDDDRATDLIDSVQMTLNDVESAIENPNDNALATFRPDAPNVEAPVLGPAKPTAVATKVSPADVKMQTLLEPLKAPLGGGFEGRTADRRKSLAIIRGGTPESERAVDMALAWLAAHQLDDGSWRFNHNKSLCRGHCRNPGDHAGTTGATGLALLPFLGAGHTPEHGEYKKVVERGLYYLSSRMIVSRKGGDLMEGTMYAHGIATVALCEAYAMTQDRTYRADAQAAVDFICNAQHPAGGWRYTPGQPGDTTVFGWQLMALKSARMAGLHVPSPIIERAKSYLDSVQVNGGALYGYQKPEKSPTPTSVGLLSRMYTGWRQDDERLHRGVLYLDSLGPSKTDVYFNYYATQVMIHHDGPNWPRWNLKLREHLIATQAKRGHESGSWFFPDKHAAQAGGRLYTTAMATMILEVYYRHMPLYTNRSMDVGF